MKKMVNQFLYILYVFVATAHFFLYLKALETCIYCDVRMADLAKKEEVSNFEKYWFILYFLNANFFLMFTRYQVL